MGYNLPFAILGKPYAWMICSIFPLCMESTNKSVASRFLASTPTCTPIQWIVRIKEIVDSFLWELFWFFKYSSKSYTSVNFGDFEVTFLQEGQDAACHPLLYCVLVILVIALLKQYLIEFPCFLYFRHYFIKTSSFSAFNCFQNIVEFKFDVQSIMNKFLYYFVCNFRKVAEQILEMFFPLPKSFFFTASF